MKTRLFQHGQLIAALIMGVTAHKASAADYSSEQAYLQEFPVLLTASRLSQPLSEAPSAMTVIDREMIVASGFRKIPDLFKLVPGIYVSYYKGSQATASYHGTSDQFARRMQVLIDGPIRAVLITGDTSTAFIKNATECEWPVLHKPIDTSQLQASLGM